MSDLRALPQFGKYRVVYADPPWSFETWSHRGQGKGASQHYATQDLDWLKKLPVGELAAADAALFLWVVQPLLPEALELIGAWGFKYKTVGYVWVKTKDEPGSMLFWDEAWDQSATRLGLGYHTRSGAEQCWIATRGKGYERLSKGEPQVVHAGLREHSRKPDSIADSIVRLAEGPRVELFARQQRAGFDPWGNQIDKFGGGSTVAGPAPNTAPEAPSAGLGSSLGSAAGVSFQKMIQERPATVTAAADPGPYADAPCGESQGDKAPSPAAGKSTGAIPARAARPAAVDETARSDDDLLEIPDWLRRDPVTNQILGAAR